MLPKAKLPLGERLKWCTCLMKLLSPWLLPFPLVIVYSCHLVLCPLGTQETMDHYQSCPSHVYVHACLSLYRKAHKYIKKTCTDIHLNIQSQKHCDKHKYAQRGYIESIGKTIQHTHPCLCSHICTSQPSHTHT